MNNKAVIFDMDGVIIDSEPIYMKVDTEFFKSLGVIVPKKVIETFAGSNANQIITEVYTQVGLPFTIEQTKVLHSKYLEENLRLNFKEIFNKDILSFLDMLLDNNIKIAIASSSKQERIIKMVQECDISKYFTKIVSGHQFKESKPNPEIYTYTAKSLNTEPTDCIVIEDSFKGISAGKSAGMKVFAKKHKSIAVNLNSADKIFFNFNEIKLEDILS